MEVDGDEEEGAYAYPITCVELLNGKCNALMKAKLGHSRHPVMWTNLRWRVKIDEDQS